MKLAQSSNSLGCLPGTNEVLVADGVVRVEEQSRLIAWAKDQRANGKMNENPQDPGAYSTPFRSVDGGLTPFTKLGPSTDGTGGQKLIWVPQVKAQVDPLPEEFWRIRDRVIDLLGLHSLEEDHYKGSFLSYIAPGSGVHQHRDDRLKVGAEELMILRCNVLFRRPHEGGLPECAGKEVDVQDRGMWAFFPTEVVHSATEVRGSESRGLLSFGFLVHFADLWQRRFHIAPSFEIEYGLNATDGARAALADGLTRSSQTAGIAAVRLDVMRFVVLSAADFSVQEAADSLRRDPMEIWNVLKDLQKTDVVESNSSARSDRGRVMVL